MTVCKHCGKEIYEEHGHWWHKPLSCEYAKINCDQPKAEPLEEYVTPTEGPTLPEVEVSNNGIDWVKAKLIRIIYEMGCNYPFIVAFEMPDTHMYAYAQCRMRKEIE